MGERIAVIQRDRTTRALLADVLEATGYEVRAFDNAWAAATDGKFRLVIADTLSAAYERSANQLLVRRLRATFNCPVLILTAHVAARHDALALGSDAVVVKPFDLSGFVRIVRSLVGSAERRRMPRALEDAGRGLGQPSSM